MSDVAYSTQGVSLFSGISGSGSIIPAGIGFGLITTGLVLRLVFEQFKAATGQKPDFGAVFMEALICICLLAFQGTIAHNVWATAQTIAAAIYPDTKMLAFAKLLGAVAGRFKDYSFNVLDIGSSLKDSAVVATAIFVWMLTLLAHWQLEVLQVCVFNVVFAFSPVLIGLSMFGLGGRRLWFSALIEVSSWSITMAVVYKTIDAALYGYLKDVSTMSPGDTHFIDVISLLTFLASLPFVVPVVTGRLIGSGALGALGQVTMGSTMTDSLFAGGRTAAQDFGGAVKPGASDVTDHTAATDKRPGDN